MRRFLASSLFLLIAVLLLIVSADVLIYGHVPGWSLGLFVFLLAAAIMARSRCVNMHVIAINVLIVGIIASLVLQPRFLNVILALILIASLAAFSRNPFTTRLTTLLRHGWGLAGGFFYRWLVDRMLMFRWMRRHQARRPAMVRFIAGWVIPVIFGTVFIMLFANANPVFDMWVGTCTDFISRVLSDVPDYIGPLRVLFWIMIALMSWSLLRARRLRPMRRGIHVALPQTGGVSTGLLARCLLVFNVIFAVQSILDGTFLWAHAELPRHMTYASYAHRGAYLLVITALLAAGFIALTFRQIHTSGKLLRWLLWVWIVQNIFLMISTLLRLDLYVSVYSLTYWRIAAAIWMLLIALGFVWFLIALRLRRDLAWLVRVNMMSCFIILYLCCFPSFAGIIAEFNVSHCREFASESQLPAAHLPAEPSPAPIDLEYLIHLGPEATPAVRQLLPHLQDEVQRQRIQDAMENHRRELECILGEWQSWTLRRHWMRDQSVRFLAGAGSM